VLTDNCFAKCEQANEAPFMTVSEGLCFRNCITKFNAFYPTLKSNLVDAPFRYYEEKTHNLLLQKDEAYAAKCTDEWGEKIAGIANEYIANKQL
jgi:hypothetical protein